MPVTLGLSSDWLGHNDQEGLHLEPLVCGISRRYRPEPESVMGGDPGQEGGEEGRESKAPTRHGSAGYMVFGIEPKSVVGGDPG